MGSEAGPGAAVAAIVAVVVFAAGCTAGTGDDAPIGMTRPSTETAPSLPYAPTPGSSAAAGEVTSPPTTPTPSPTPVAVHVPLRVERRTGDPATEGFAEQAMSILTDDRGWVRAGFRFTTADAAPYLLVLAEGDEVDRLCEPYDTGGRFSCQNGPVVALNADRWRTATPEWPDDLDSYRTYLVNHEVGHLLHLHHPSPQCPGQGLPAPVMLQQSTELGSCDANAWPLPWEVDLAAARNEPLAPPADHEIENHQASPPPEHQDFEHRAG